MPALSALHLHKSFGPQVVLSDASFSLARGEKVGLIGANGTGKSTLAKILAGLEPVDEGVISVRRGLTIAYLAQEPVLDPTRSARETVEDGLTAWRAAVSRHAEVSAALTEGRGDDALLAEQAELDDRIQRLGGYDRGHVALDLLARLGVRDVDREVGPRSGGERRRIALARLLVQRPDVAILDEPTNHLDADTAGWLEEHLANEFPGAIVLVTHDRYFLDAVVERIVELDRGGLAEYPGGYSAYLEKKALLLEHEERKERNRQNILRREREWLSRGPKARGTKAKARIQRAEALEAQTPANAGRGATVELLSTTVRAGKTILELRDVVLGAGSGEGRVLTGPITLSVAQGERIGVVGPNGIGKTTLLRAILHAAETNETSPSNVLRTGVFEQPVVPRAGQIVVGRNTRIAYLDQARAGLDDSKSIFDEVKSTSGTTVEMASGETMDLRTYLEGFLFDPGKQRQPVGSLSGGERARVALAKMLRSAANVLLFDEPTNDLDLPTLAALEEMLMSWPGSAIVVTHDRAFLDRVATSTLAFEVPESGGPAKVEKHGGGYSDYVAHRAELKARVAEAAASAPPPKATSAPAAQTSAEPKKRKALTWSEERELEGLLEQIDAADTEVRRLEAQLGDPAVYTSRGPELGKLTEQLEAARRLAAAKLARWEELETKKAGG